MSLYSIIQDSKQAAASLNLQLHVDALSAEAAILSQEHYKVAFVGQFKVGKSTLINRTILKEDILFTDVLEATSVPTELVYGAESRLEIFHFEHAQLPLNLPDQLTGSTSIITGERIVESIANPTTAQIRQYTCGETAEERSQLAQRVSRVKLTYPAENLRGFTVIDTAGINSTTEAVVTTTYRIIPSSDLTILVVPPKGLSEIDIEFLRGKIFEAGITRCMVVINYDSRFAELDSDHLVRIQSTIKAQLTNMGRPGIEVAIAEGVSGGTLPPGGLEKQLRDAADDVFDPFKNFPGATSAGSETRSTPTEATSFERNLVTFIRDNIRPGREEKMRIRIRSRLSALFREIEIELATIGQSEDQRKVSLQKAQHAVKQTQAEYEVLRHQFLKDLRLIQKQHELDLTQGLNRLMQQFYGKIDETKTLADTQNVILTSKKWMKSDVEALVQQVAINTRPKIQHLQQNYAVRWAETARAWEDVQVDLNLEGGILEKVPPFLVNIADYALTILVLPFPFFIDLLIRFIAEKIPALAQFIPANLVIAILKTSVKRNCDEQFQIVIEETEQKIRDAYQQAEEKIEQAWKEGVVAQSQSILDPMHRVQQGTDFGRKTALENARTQVQNILSQL
jgi:hypothetical protein